MCYLQILLLIILKYSQVGLENEAQTSLLHKALKAPPLVQTLKPSRDGFHEFLSYSSFHKSLVVSILIGNIECNPHHSHTESLNLLMILSP